MFAAGTCGRKSSSIIAGQNYRDMNSAETKAHVAWLKESIRTEGVKDPIDVIFRMGSGIWLREAASAV